MDLAEQLDRQGNGPAEQPGDVEQIGWLLQTASELPSLQSLAAAAVRSALHSNAPSKITELALFLPLPLRDFVLKEDTFK